MPGTALASPCDVCPMPGQCCRHIRLYGRASGSPSPLEGPNYTTFWDKSVHRDMRKAFKSQPGNPVPFKIESKIGTWKTSDGRAYSAYVYSCPNLDSLGRCGDYSHRPHLCRVYAPQGETNCLLYTAPVRLPETGSEAKMESTAP